MPSFFHSMRRRSRANFTDQSSNESGPPSEASSQAAHNVPVSSSTSTLNSSNGASARPDTHSAPRVTTQPNPSAPVTSQRRPSTFRRTSSKKPKPPLGQLSEAPPVPLRPATLIAQNKRYSSGSVYSQSMTTAPGVPISMYAPRVLSITDNTWVNQKVLLIYGQAGPGDRPLDGTITITHHQDHFPATNWPVTDTHFKALVHLCPGTNDLRLDFSSPRLVGNNAPNALHTARLRVNYMPLNTAPPLHLVILLAKDSPGTFDASPEKINKEGNTLEVAVRKFRMTAHLWSAFTAEQMYRNGFGRRTFRFEEEYQAGTLSNRDPAMEAMRNESRVHVIRSDKTLAEIRDLDVAQQHKEATRKNDLFAWALESCRTYFKSGERQRQYVALLLLDSHWEKDRKLITGHAALGGGSQGLQLGIFGSQALHTYPSTIEEVVPALTDCTKTNTDFVAADGGEDSGQHWQAACIGMGAHLHEVGHALGCPHQVNGIMEHAYWHLNRTFVTAEAYSTRTKQAGLRPCLPSHECGWHRLDVLRFRHHPCFRAAYDLPQPPEHGVQVWAVEQGRFILTASTGIAFVELFTEGDQFCSVWLEYADRDGVGDGLQRHVELTEADLRARLPQDRRNKKLRLEVHSLGGARAVVEDIRAAAADQIRMPNGKTGFLGPKVGSSGMQGTAPAQVLLSSVVEKMVLLTNIRVFHGFSIHGIEFMYEDGTTALFGKREKEAKDVPLDVRRGETLAGFYVRAGFWIDGLAVITTTGRRSEVYGNANGGEEFTLMPPRGFRIAGVHGTCAQWIDGIGIVIAR